MEERYARLTKIMLNLGRTRRRIADREFREMGIHPAQHMTLMLLSKEGRMNSQARLAEHLCVSAANVARTLKGLEAGGFISREDADGDSRRNEIVITPAGEEIICESKACFQRIERASFQGFSEEEMDTLEMLLGRVLTNLSGFEAGKGEDEN